MDIYQDYVFDNILDLKVPLLISIPEGEIAIYEHNISFSGMVQIGWTAPDLFNDECSFEIFDLSETVLYSSGLDPAMTTPMMGVGTDANDDDNSIH